MAKEGLKILRQHFGLLVEDMLISNNAAIATIVENSDKEAFFELFLRTLRTITKLGNIIMIY